MLRRSGRVSVGMAEVRSFVGVGPREHAAAPVYGALPHSVLRSCCGSRHAHTNIYCAKAPGPADLGMLVTWSYRATMAAVPGNTSLCTDRSDRPEEETRVRRGPPCCPFSTRYTPRRGPR